MYHVLGRANRGRRGEIRLMQGLQYPVSYQLLPVSRPVPECRTVYGSVDAGISVSHMDRFKSPHRESHVLIDTNTQAILQMLLLVTDHR